MDTKEILDKEFSEQKFPEEHPNAEILNRYKEIACNYARMENAIAVLSDLRNHASYIYYGRFSQMLGAGNRKKEGKVSSIWEDDIFGLIHPDDLASKHLQELRFFHFIKSQPRRSKQLYTRIASYVLYLRSLRRYVMAGFMPLQSFGIRDAGQMRDNRFRQRQDNRTGRIQRHENTVHQREAGTDAHRQRFDEQGNIRDTLH